MANEIFLEKHKIYNIFIYYILHSAFEMKKKV